MHASIRIVLVETTHPGNIGAAARAMKNMGLSRLYLVQPSLFPSEAATARAAGADDLLQRAVPCGNLDEALAGCRLVIGMSARRRRLSCPMVTPREALPPIRDVLAAAGEVAILFGRESSGLSNEELDRCHLHVHIPCNPEFSSLNVAAAVQVMSYELNLGLADSCRQGEPPADAEPLATVEQVEGFYVHLQEVMAETGFLKPRQPGVLMRRMRRLFNRIRLEHEEIQILRGVLTAVQRTLARKGP